MTWTDEQIGTLKRLWAADWTSRMIAKQMSAQAGYEITFNAVLGQVHRLGLPSRGSPIGKPMPSSGGRKPRVREARPHLVTMVKPKVVTLIKPPVAKLSGLSCQWPVGDPKAPDFHRCGAPAVFGKPYCGDHCAKAYAGYGA